MGLVLKLALAALLASVMGQAALAANESAVPSGPVPPPPGSTPLPPPPGKAASGTSATAKPMVTGKPEVLKAQAIGAWSLHLYKLPGVKAHLCVVSRTFPSGDRLGLIIAPRGNGIIYGHKKLTIKDGEQPDISFSVDHRPVIDMPATAYDHNSITSMPLARPDGDKLIDIFARGRVAVLGSDKLGIHSGEMPLTGAAQAVKALRVCARDQGVHTRAVSNSARLPEPPPPARGAQAHAPTGAPPPGASAAPQVQNIAPKAQEAIKDVVLAEAKKHKAGVGVAVTMPKDVTGDNIADAVIIFTLLEGKQRHGYATVLKTIGKNKFKPLNTVSLGGIPSNDPPVFTKNGFIVTVTAPGKETTSQVDVVVSKDKLRVK